MNDSWLECGPKRPPRRQKSPVGSGTSKVATEYGVRSVGDVHHEGELADLLALVAERLRDQQHEVARAAGHGRRPVRHAHPEHREAGVPAPGGRHVEPADLGIEQVLRGGRELLARLRIAREQLLAVHDLQHALGPGAVGEVHAVLVGDGPVHALRGGPGRARLLAGQPEVADEARLRGIAQVVDLGHAVGAPAGRRAVGDQVGDAGVALPPVLVRALEPVEDRGDAARASRDRSRPRSRAPGCRASAAGRSSRARRAAASCRRRRAPSPRRPPPPRPARRGCGAGTSAASDPSRPRWRCRSAPSGR